jgi:CTP synthase (UTP-ammonia lyase)
MKVALVGDYDATVLAHQAIPGAIERSALALATTVELIWIHSSEIDLQAIAAVDALWCVPLSPYADPEAVITVIRFAREHDMPFLGTCAGYQHAVLEYARNVHGFVDADSSEDNPETSMPLITALACRLADQADTIHLDHGSRIAGIYQTEHITEEYNCGFGINRDYLPLFVNSDFRFCARDDNGDPRAFELNSNRFFFGTAYQPERSSLQQITHPLITAFLMAALQS